MATSTELHTAIGSVLDGVTGLRGFPTPPEGVSPPFAFPVLIGWEPATFGRSGVRVATFEVYIITAKTARPQDGYNSLLSFIDWSGSASVYLALWDANSQTAGTFSGLADTQVTALEYRQMSVIEMDALQGYGGVFSVQITTKE